MEPINPEDFVNCVSYGIILTANEEKGFQFESQISESLFACGIEHNELPHLFKGEFKRDISQGPDFKFKIGNSTVCVEAKNWEKANSSQLDKVKDRFMGKGNYGDENICVVKKLHTSGFFKHRHELKKLGIKLMTDSQLSWYLMKKRNKGVISNYIKSLLKRYFVYSEIINEFSHETKPYLKHFIEHFTKENPLIFHSTISDELETLAHFTIHQVLNENKMKGGWDLTQARGRVSRMEDMNDIHDKTLYLLGKLDDYGIRPLDVDRITLLKYVMGILMCSRRCANRWVNFLYRLSWKDWY